MNPFKEKIDFLTSLKRISESKKPIKNIIDESATVKCKSCGHSTTKGTLRETYFVCPECGYHFGIAASYRIQTVLDENSFSAICGSLVGSNPLDFPEYDEKLKEVREKTKLKEAVITGTGKIQGKKVVIGVMDNRFLMGSMGMAVGEKITRAFEYATRKKLPIIIFSTSGGARMQEGILSLMQMAKTSASAAKHSEAGLFYTCVMTNPTTGGVTASFASLADVILAEPGALIGFAGPRVIEQTIRQSLPEGFQRAEYLKEHGFVDEIVSRENMRDSLGRLLKLYDRKVKK